MGHLPKTQTQLYSEMGTILQYSHTSDTPFDFNDKNAKAGFHRLGTENSFKNAPSGVNPIYSNVLVVRNNAWDTLSMTIYLYTKGTNSSIVYKTGNTTDWANLSWSVYATKSDLEKQASFEPYVLNTNVSEYIKSLSAGKVHFFKTSSGTSGNPYTGGSCFYMVYIIDTSHNGIGLALNHSTTAYFMRISLGDVVYTKLSA